MVGCWNLNPEQGQSGLVHMLDRLRRYCQDEEVLYMYVLGDNYYYTRPAHFDRTGLLRGFEMLRNATPAVTKQVLLGNHDLDTFKQY